MSVIPKVEHLLPDNATPLERALSASDHRMLSVPVRVIRDVWSPDDCPLHLLPYLAQAWSVDEWDPNWTEAQKRQVIRDSVWIHQHKGTIGALKRAVAQLGLPARVSRWFEHGGAPYTFRLYVALDAVSDWTATTARQLYRVAVNNKALRSHLDRLVISRPMAPAPVIVAAAVSSRVSLRLVLDPITSLRAPQANVYAGAAVVSRRHLLITPRTP